jgi:predicted RNase H-like HicB family nuclease
MLRILRSLIDGFIQEVKNFFSKLEVKMERVINIHIEKLPEGVYLGTSDDVQGLVAQGRTIWETLEIARDVARKLLESQQEQQVPKA